METSNPAARGLPPPVPTSPQSWGACLPTMPISQPRLRSTGQGAFPSLPPLLLPAWLSRLSLSLVHFSWRPGARMWPVLCPPGGSAGQARWTEETQELIGQVPYPGCGLFSQTPDPSSQCLPLHFRSRDHQVASPRLVGCLPRPSGLTSTVLSLAQAKSPEGLLGLPVSPSANPSSLAFNLSVL